MCCGAGGREAAPGGGCMKQTTSTRLGTCFPKVSKQTSQSQSIDLTGLQSLYTKVNLSTQHCRSPPRCPGGSKSPRVHHCMKTYHTRPSTSSHPWIKSGQRSAVCRGLSPGDTLWLQPHQRPQRAGGQRDPARCSGERDQRSGPKCTTTF